MSDENNKNEATPQNTTPKTPANSQKDFKENVDEVSKKLVDEAGEMTSETLETTNNDDTSTPSTEKAIIEESAKENPVSEKATTASTAQAIVDEANNVANSIEDEDEEEVTSSDDEDDEDGDDAEKVDYSNLSKVELIAALKNLLETRNIKNIKDEVEDIKNEFNSLFQEALATQKEAFLAGGGNVIDFHYTDPDKKAFNEVYNEYRTKRNAHFKKLKEDLEANLAVRTALIEEIKTLVENDKSANNNYNKIKNIQDRWRDAGPIPRDKYNTVWNNYHHYIEIYYDALHLDREFRDLDFKRNLEEKQKLITRTQELAQETNIDKAFRELQLIHRRWKEEIGPVAREFRDEIWDTFSAATKVIHEKKMAAEEALQEKFKENYAIKKELIGLIDKVRNETKNTHGAWQKAMQNVQEIRDVFFQAGRVPRERNKEIWASFKETTRNFNKAKNDFYKNQKAQQFDNLEKKKALIKIAEDNKDNEDFNAATPLFKKIQQDWKKIGHVPRKESDKIWKEFKKACNHYFDRLHAAKDDENKEELENFTKKQALLGAIDSIELTGTHKEKLATIKEQISNWKAIGRVPFKKKNIDQKFNAKLDELFSKLDMDKKEREMIKFENKVSSMVSQEDDRKLQNEQFFISKKIDETKAEIMQLENNLGFFQHVDDDNPLVKEVHSNIAKHREQLELWKDKLQKIKTMRAD